jgi:hypothetical protein
VSLNNGCKRVEKTAANQGVRSLESIVDDFNREFKDRVDEELDHYKGEKSFFDVIGQASWFENCDGRKHPHQHRIKTIAIRDLSVALSDFDEAALQKLVSFDELHDFIKREAGCIPGIGELAVYDTATRIGSYLGLYPKYVYLHCGTREGAQNILGRRLTEPYLPKSDFPEELNDLSPDQIENLLCIFKRQLDKVDRKV